MEEEKDIAAIKVENTELKATVATLKIEIETKQELLKAKPERCDFLEEEKINNTERKKYSTWSGWTNICRVGGAKESWTNSRCQKETKESQL